MRTKTIVATVACASLGLSACGADDPLDEPSPAQETVADATTPEETIDPAPEVTPETTGEETAEATEEPDEAGAPTGDFPFDEGAVSPEEFADRYLEAVEAVDEMTVTSFVDGLQTSITGFDLTDRDNPVSYTVMEADGQIIESVSDNDGSWTRIGGEGEWEEMSYSDVNLETLVYGRDMFDSVELLDAEQRQFRVAMLLAEEGTTTEVLLWLDDEFRVVRSEAEAAGFDGVTEYDYDAPVEIPDVG